MADIDELTYKKEKEDFVSNLSGSSLEEILLVILVVPITTLFQRSLMKRFESLRDFTIFFQFMFDYITTIVPIIVSCTFTQSTFVMYFIMLSFTIFNFATAKRAKTLKSTVGHHVPAESKDDKDLLKLLNHSKKPYLNTYRSGMMILTCIAILAVDFRIFPRAYAKTETYGISLMDVGVGCFIVSGALVSRKARSANDKENSLNKSRDSPKLTPKKPGSPRAERYRKEKAQEQLASDTDQVQVTPVSSPQLSRASVPQTGMQRAISALKAMALLLAVGLIRFTIIKALNYQEHVTEYGEHWNFFLTLAIVGLVTVVLDMDVHLTGVFGFVLLVAYQVLLTHVGVENYILNAPRTNFFNQNREGIISLLGYLGLYFMSVELGYWVNKNKSKNGWWIFAGAMAVLSFFAWILCSFVQIRFGVPSSRRMANMPYSLLVLTINLQILALCLGVDLITLPKPNLILSSISATRNSQLIVFLLILGQYHHRSSQHFNAHVVRITVDELLGTVWICMVRQLRECVRTAAAAAVIGTDVPWREVSTSICNPI